MDILEQRSMFTMWAALPGPLILSADLRSSAMNTGYGLDDDVLAILNNTGISPDLLIGFCHSQHIFFIHALLLVFSQLVRALLDCAQQKLSL